MVTQMISVGEETGSLDTMLHKIADFYEDEVNAKLKALTSILEPIMMIGRRRHRRHRRHLDVPADLLGHQADRATRPGSPQAWQHHRKGSAWTPSCVNERRS